jgi:nucleoid-associated protein YgaU
LIALNHIEDPRKLQIGQKLRIPEKKIKSKHTED